MSTSEKVKLMKEYVKSYLYVFRILEVSGFCRFIIRNEKIVARTSASVIYNVFLMIMINTSAAVMLWTANIGEKSLSTVEFGAVIHFAIFSNLLLSHITFIDKHSGPILIQNCIDIDCYLDPGETEFMRHRTIKIYKYTVFLVGILQVALVSQMYYFFHVPLIIHIFGTIFFFWIIFAYNDFCFFLYLYWFLTTRAHYLNIALLKITKMNIEYIPKHWLFHKLLWGDKFDDYVTFHTRNKDFSIALKMLINELQHIQGSCRFPIILGFSTVILGSFVTVQTFVMYIQASTMMARASVITCWVVGSWFFLLLITTFPDMFYKEIERTKLICAYIQLNPTSSMAMLKLTKNVLTTLELREARASIYNLFDLDTGLILKLAASTFVYITVQLQLAFPNLENGHKFENVSRPAVFELDRNAMKEFLFLY